MNLRKGGSSQKSVPVAGWNLTSSLWDEDICRGSIRANDMYITGTDYALKKRILACSHQDRVDSQYRLIRIAGVTYIIEGENENTWRQGAYQYVYQLRRADRVAELYRLEGTTQASGMEGAPVRVLQARTMCDVASAGMLGSSEIESVDYTRMAVHFPGNLELDNDVEIDLLEDRPVTLDIVAVQYFHLSLVATSLRRGISA